MSAKYVMTMDTFNFISGDVALFFIFYGMSLAVSLSAVIYLLLRRGNAFAPDVTPPLRLRRWAASFCSIAALDHVLWFLLYIHFNDLHSENDLLNSSAYLTVVIFDFATLFFTITGTLLAMLQDRRRPVWPTFVALLPFVTLGMALIYRPGYYLSLICLAYIMLLYLFFAIYLLFAIRQYGRWLRDNYADLERKEVWLTFVLSLAFMLLFFVYTLVNADNIQFILLNIIELVLCVLLLWRVETLPQLSVEGSASEQVTTASDTERMLSGPSTVTTTRMGAAAEMAEQAVPACNEQSPGFHSNIVMSQMERLLAQYCVDTQLYLQYDLTLQQLAQALGTNRSYLSQYFSRHGMNYNSYINGLRINHFIQLYQEAVSTQRPFTIQQLADESGYHSYSTFSNAFKQRMGQSVTAWIRNTMTHDI